jgi:hypothetical protein
VGDYHDQGGGEHRVIWGTDINVAECGNAFKEFVESFCVGNEFDAYYLR